MSQDIGVSDGDNRIMPQMLVFFETDSTQLNELAMNELKTVAEWMRANPSRILIVEGHTDEVGTEDDNMVLSKNRAQSVRDYLAKQGVDPSRTVLIAHGEHQAGSGPDAVNRRTLIYATGPSSENNKSSLQ